MSETNMPGEGDPPIVMTDTGGEGDPNAPPAMVEEARPASVVTPEMASSIAAVADDTARQNIPETAMAQGTLVSVANTIPDAETVEVLAPDGPAKTDPEARPWHKAANPTMSETNEEMPVIPAGLENQPPEAVSKDDTDRPWHGAANPLEALYLHFTAEITALKEKFSK